MNKIESSLRQVFQTQRDYFRDQMDEINMRNLQLMRIISWVGIIFYVVYYMITAVFFRDWSISVWYAMVIPLLLGFLFYIHKVLVNKEARMKTARMATLLFFLCLMGYLILMSVFPHPDVPAVYYPLFLVISPVVFILPVVWHLVFSVGSLAIFYALVMHFKLPEIWSHELFEATTALVFSLIVNILMTEFRVQSDNLKDKYYRMSQVDGLTGIMNKAAGKEVCEDYLRTKKKDTFCAALFVDLDNFKKINDQYGHGKGDQILSEVGTALRLICRKEDIVFRFGGDEFFVLLVNMEHVEHVEKKAQRIVDYMQVVGKQQDIELSCSVGICYGRGDLELQLLSQKADEALYQAKMAGRNRYVVEQLNTR